MPWTLISRPKTPLPPSLTLNRISEERLSHGRVALPHKGAAIKTDGLSGAELRPWVAQKKGTGRFCAFSSEFGTIRCFARSRAVSRGEL
jgi:hypothetical protein